MRRKLLFLSFVFFSLNSMGQVDVKFDVEGMKENSAIMLDALYNCYGKDSMTLWIDSLCYHGVFVCEIDSKGIVVDIPKYFSKNSSFSKEELIRIRKFLQKKKKRFNVVYINEFGENEDSLRTFVKQSLKHHFKLYPTKKITVGFPGNLSGSWNNYFKGNRDGFE